MTGSIKKIFNLIHNMGWRYVAFRAWHELLRHSGMLKNRFPAAPAHFQYLKLSTWKMQPKWFFFKDRETLQIPHNPTLALKERFEQIKSGKLLLFNSTLADLGTDYDWVTNPDTGFRYDSNKHWTAIADYSKTAGDIKYVWEKSRFSYLYDIIRYDHHFREDCSDMVFRDIVSWIDSNPVNCGPNYRCSQEMSLRVMNWVFALHYYQNSPHLTPEVFDKMQYAIYWHFDHIYKNINFSRIAVRNNHAITETLMLYLSCLFFPSMPYTAIWSKKAKKWLEEEIAYQIYEDGTFLQYSMNYHRVVVQLLTWAIVLSEKMGERLADIVYSRARLSVQFLRTCMIDENGMLPNYGANDGALFFKLNDADYRDYRPTLQALAAALKMDIGLPASEDSLWYGLTNDTTETWMPTEGTHSFEDGGYYIMREPDTLTFIKCGGYKDRPQHADNLHLDVWYKGENILIDAGSYKYNTDAETIRYFSGTASHNTIMLDDKDQMLKGGHFIWYYWSAFYKETIKEEDGSYIFDGIVYEYRYIHKNFMHQRCVIKKKGIPEWQVTDEVFHKPDNMTIRQLWHLPLSSKYIVAFTAKDQEGKELEIHKGEGWFSGLYGQKEKANEYYFSTEKNKVATIIKLKDL